MQTPADQTSKILLTTEAELFDQLIEADNPFRKLREIINFDELVKPLRARYSDIGQTGIDIEKGFKSLLIQFWEDYSDRQMEKAIRHNIAIRWFCGFSLTENTPDHSYFGKLRKRIGTEQLTDIFNNINKTLKDYGLFGNVFHFVDASAIVTKTALWEERDKAIKDGEETLNNAVVSKYAKDTDARWGAKSKRNIWFGYKRHNAVDMRHGLIEKTVITPANVPDYKALTDICPNRGMVFMDKLYDVTEADEILKLNNCHAATIRKRNNKQKSKDLDQWRSRVRMPFEGTFSKLHKRARYRGLFKVNFQNYMASMVHNLKKAVTILPRAPVLIGA